ncbi:glycosyltransferase [Thermaurantiacus sp.]
MRILTILHDLSAGGSERVALQLAAEWRNLGLQSELLLVSSNGKAEVPPELPVRRLPRDVPRSLTSRFCVAASLRAAVREAAPDIVFLPGNWHFALARGIARVRPRPVIVAKLSNPPLPSLVPGTGPLAVRALRALLKPVDVLAFWPEALGPDLARLLPDLRLEPIPNPPIRVEKRPRRPRPASRRRHLLIAGRLVPQKNVALALEAFAIALGNRDLDLTIAGDGPDRPALENRIARLGLGGRVTMLGHVANLGPALDAADLLLLSSRYEGTPAVVFEALAAGVPVVSTACAPILPHLLDRPGRGRVVSEDTPSALAQAILAQLAEPDEVGDVRDLLAPHAPDAVARRYVDLFTALLAAPGRRAAE